MRLTRVILLLTALSGMAMTAADGQRTRDDDDAASGELGYVTGDGIVLHPDPAFASASRAVSGASDRAHSKWKTCMGGFDVGKIFSLSRREQYDYRRNPERYCGPEPRDVSDERAESFQVRETLYSISQGRRLGGVVASFSFTTGGEQIVPGSDRLAGKCVVLTNAAGQLIPVRSDRSRDPYAFSNPFQKNADPVTRYQTESQQLADRISSNQSQLSNLQDQLAGSRAWRNRQCVRPASGAIPPRPAAMSQAAITAAAKGFCTDMSMRRLPKSTVIAALRSNYMDEYIAAQSAWVRGSKPQCAINIRSQIDDQMTLMMSRYGPTMGGYGMIQDDIHRCEAIARSSCGAPVAAWESQVAAIRAGPEAEMNQCQAMVSKISSTRATIANDEPQLRQAMANLEAARAAPQQGPRRLPLSQAQCDGGR